MLIRLRDGDLESRVAGTSKEPSLVLDESVKSDP